MYYRDIRYRIQQEESGSQVKEVQRDERGHGTFVTGTVENILWLSRLCAFENLSLKEMTFTLTTDLKFSTQITCFCFYKKVTYSYFSPVPNDRYSCHKKVFYLAVSFGVSDLKNSRGLGCLLMHTYRTYKLLVSHIGRAAKGCALPYFHCHIYWGIEFFCFLLHQSGVDLEHNLYDLK